MPTLNTATSYFVQIIAEIVFLTDLCIIVPIYRKTSGCLAAFSLTFIYLCLLTLKIKMEQHVKILHHIPLATGEI